MKKYTLPVILSLFSVISFAQQATFNWVTEPISEGNNLKGMTVSGDSSAVIIGYDNTFLKKNSQSQNWTNIETFKTNYDFMGLGANGNSAVISSRRTKIVDHPKGGKPDVFVSGILLKSDNRGENWSLLDVNKIGSGDNPSMNPNADGTFYKDVYAVGMFNPDSFLVFTGWYDLTTGTKESHGGIFLTKDNGETWTPIVTGLGSKIINEIDVSDSIAISGGNNSLYKTNIKDGTTIDIYPNLAEGTDSNLYIFTVKMMNPDTFYIATTTDGVYRTTDGGNTFTMFEEIGGGNDVLPLNDSSIIVLGSSSKSKISTDKGATWTNCYPGETCYKIGGILGDTLYGMANAIAYKIAVSDLVEKNFNWKTTELNPGGRLQKMHIYDNHNAVVIGYSGLCKKTTDGGLTWTQCLLPEDFNEDIEFDYTSISNSGVNAFTTIRRYKIVDFPSSSEINDFFMEGLILRTTDNWNSYSMLDISKIGAEEGYDVAMNPQLDGCFGLNPYYVKCVDANTAYLFANWYEDVTTGDTESHGRIFKTTDGGETWSGITHDLGGLYVNDIALSGNIGYIAGNKVLLKTVDGGTTFTDLYPTLVEANEGDSNIFINAVILVNSEEFYLPTSSDGVFVTKDGGTSYTKMENVNGTNDIYLLDSNSFMLLGTSSKSFFTNDGGTTWQDPSVGSTVFSIGEVFKDSLYALANGVIYKIAVNDLDITTSTQEIAEKRDFQILYDSDHINITSDNNVIEQCLVYSIAGQLVAIKQPYTNICRLYNHKYKPGIYVVAVSVNGEKFIDKIVFR